MRRSVRSVACCCALLACATGVRAQQLQTAVIPDTITVGDVFHAAIRLQLPANARVLAPDTLSLGEDLELAGRREIRRDSITGRTTIIYPLTAWRPGEHELPPVELQVVSDGAATTLTAALPSFSVTSVLPPDTAGVEARPAKDVLGANRVWWPILLAALLALLVAAALYIWWRRRRRTETVVFTPAVPPRDAALAQLSVLAREGLLETGDYRRFYARLTAIMRHFAEAVEPRWSVDLTTTELAAQLRRDIDALHALELVRLLGAADLVKFARATTTRDSALRDLDGARAWIDHIAPEPAPADDASRRAA